MRRLLLAVLLAVGVIVGCASAASAAPVGPDCKGDPPVPGTPYGFLVSKPATTSDGDPFATPDTVSIESVYGTNFRWWVYDNGCNAGSDVLPKVGSSVGQLLGLELPGLVPSWGTSLMSAVVNPTWAAPLDQFVLDATQATKDGVWLVWLVLMLTLVGVQVLLRAVRGALATAISGVVWALAVLVIVTAAIDYPSEATHLLDDGIQTAVTATAEGFADGTQAAPAGATSGEQAQAALDHQWDVLTRSTLYRSWLEGAFGSADSASAVKYGPELFKATHFSWSEWDVYSGDPNGAGKVIITDKGEHFRQVAQQLAEGDPVAYEHFTGNDWSHRVGVGFLSLLQVAIVAWFLLVAAVVILISYLLVRLLVPVLPAAGVFFIIDTFRDTAIGWLRKVAGLFVMGPLYFIAALVVSRFNTAILGTQLSPVLKLIFIGAIAVAAWRLLQPRTFLGQQVKLPGLQALTTYFAARHGAHEAVEDLPRDRREDRPADDVVHQSTPRPTPADTADVAPSAASSFSARMEEARLASRDLPGGPALREADQPHATPHLGGVASRIRREPERREPAASPVVHGPVEVYNPRSYPPPPSAEGVVHA